MEDNALRKTLDVLQTEMCVALERKDDAEKLRNLIRSWWVTITDCVVPSLNYWDSMMEELQKSLTRFERRLSKIERPGEPTLNCERFGTAEDAYNACPRFCSIDPKDMSDRELEIVASVMKAFVWLYSKPDEKAEEQKS